MIQLKAMQKCRFGNTVFRHANLHFANTFGKQSIATSYSKIFDCCPITYSHLQINNWKYHLIIQGVYSFPSKISAILLQACPSP